MKESQFSGLGLSPDLSIELNLHGEKFAVASVGLDGVSIRSPKGMGPGRAELAMNIGGEVSIFYIMLTEGVDPQRYYQPFLLTDKVEEAAA